MRLDAELSLASDLRRIFTEYDMVSLVAAPLLTVTLVLGIFVFDSRLKSASNLN